MQPFLVRLVLVTGFICLLGALAVAWWLSPGTAVSKPKVKLLPIPSLKLPQITFPSGSDPDIMALRRSIQRGESIYQQLCHHCHGRQGLGDNNAYMDSIGHTPANHTDLIDMQKLSDADFFIALRDGVKDKRGWLTMPPWSSVLTEADLWDVIAYVRRLPLAAD